MADVVSQAQRRGGVVWGETQTAAALLGPSLTVRSLEGLQAAMAFSSGVKERSTGDTRAKTATAACPVI